MHQFCQADRLHARADGKALLARVNDQPLAGAEIGFGDSCRRLRGLPRLEFELGADPGKGHQHAALAVLRHQPDPDQGMDIAMH